MLVVLVKKEFNHRIKLIYPLMAINVFLFGGFVCCNKLVPDLTYLNPHDM